MKLLNLAIGFSILGLLGLVIMFMGNLTGLYLILVAELGAFICVWSDQRLERYRLQQDRLQRIIRRAQ